MEQTLLLRKAADGALAALGAAGLIAVSACAGGERLPPAPQASPSVSPARAMTLRSTGYDAPAVADAEPGAGPGARSGAASLAAPAVLGAEPPRPQPAAYGGTDGSGTEGAAPDPYFTGPAPAPTVRAEAEVPAPPRRAYASAPRAPLPDLDAIVVTDERAPVRTAPVRTAQVFEGETRSVLPTRPAPAPARQASPPRPAPAAAPSGPARAEGAAIHLASYRSVDQAEAGWAVLTRDHPAILAGLAPATTAVEVPGRGRFVRLIAGPVNARQAGTACAALERQGAWCAVVDWSGDRL